MTKRKPTTMNFDPNEDESEDLFAEETAVTKPVEEEAQPASPAPVVPESPQKQPVSEKPVPPGTLVWVRLDGLETAVVGNHAVLVGEIVQVQYQHYTQAKEAHPGKFSVKLPGAKGFVTE